jgi:hypothetical protein
MEAIAAVLRGALCESCRAPETDCAWSVHDGGCCPSCSHWTAYDDAGNPKVTPRWGLALPIGDPCGSEVGFQRHLRYRERCCQDCRIAHYRHKGWL